MASLSELIAAADGPRTRLQELTASIVHSNGNYSPAGEQLPSPADVVVTPFEVNEVHGSGLLLLRIFEDSSSIISIRSASYYAGKERFGAARFCLSRRRPPRCEIYSQVRDWLFKVAVRRVFCSPYLAEDAIAAIAVKDIFGVPLCTYLMDDQNVCDSGIPDVLMEELISKSDLRLVISPEMRIAYEKKYRQKFWLLPPLVPGELIRTKIDEPRSNLAASRGVLVGNVWGQRWLDLLRTTFRGSGYQIDWYCNQKNPLFLNFDRAELERDGIRMCDPLPEPVLVSVLQNYSYAIVPSGTFEDHAVPSLQAIAELSLPSKVPFLFATSHLPILVLGDTRTSASRNVERFGVGATARYDSAALRAALGHLLKPDVQASIRRRAAALSQTFSAKGAEDWVWRSLEKGEPVDLKFEKLMPMRAGEFAYYVEAAPPKEIQPDFVPTYQALRRIVKLHYSPSFVIDAGSSTGVWSYTASKLFPEARFILVDPLISRYPREEVQAFTSRLRNCELVEVALSDRAGSLQLKIASNLYGSSLLHLGSSAELKEVVEVEVVTLDDLTARLAIIGRGILKVDVQYAEHLVLNGGRQFIAGHVDIVILELSLTREVESAKTLPEMIEFMNQLGFRYFDDAGEWRAPATGLLEQKDVMFARNDLFETSSQSANITGKRC